jgi:hypothetical protein
MLKLRSYGMTIHMRTTREGAVSWDKDEIIFKGIRVGVEGIISTVQTVVLQCGQILREELLYTEADEDDFLSGMGARCEGGGHGGGLGLPEKLPAIRWSEIHDNAADFTVGWSFVKGLLGTEPRSRGWLLRTILRDAGLKQRWIGREAAGEVEFRRDTASGYGLAIERFPEGLLFLVHFSGGQPSRGPELVSIRIRNTADGGIRNVFIDRGAVMTVIGYHKGYTRTEQLKIVH